MTRQRPVAGQRNRSRLGSSPVAEQPCRSRSGRPRADPAAPARRTAVLDRAPATPRRRPSRRGRRPGRPQPPGDLLVLVAALVALSLALTAGLLAVRARGEDRVEQARTAALAAAEAHAVDLLSYDYRHLDRDFARARKVLTGGFADDYAHTTETVVRPDRRAGQGRGHRRRRGVLGGPGLAEPGRGAAVREPDHHLDPPRGPRRSTSTGSG